MQKMFYRVIDGQAVIFNEDGSAATSIDADVYPIGSKVSARYEHPEGIRLTLTDAESIGIFME